MFDKYPQIYPHLAKVKAFFGWFCGFFGILAAIPIVPDLSP